MLLPAAQAQHERTKDSNSNGWQMYFGDHKLNHTLQVSLLYNLNICRSALFQWGITVNQDIRKRL
jgi:hypothetical protein